MDAHERPQRDRIAAPPGDRKQPLAARGQRRVLLIAERSAHGAELAALLSAGRAREQRPATLRVQRAGSLLEAEALLGERRFDALLLDLEGLEASPSELRARLEQASAGLPLLAVGSARQHGLAQHFDDFLARERTSAELLCRAILHAIERRQWNLALAHSQAALEAARGGAMADEEDALTGLPNRRGLERLWSRMFTAGSAPSSLCLLDLEDFRAINARFGQAVGDVVLREAARRLREALREGDQLGRCGGDEFVVLLPGTGLAEGQRIAERLIKALERTALCSQGQVLPLAASASALAIESPAPPLEDTLGRARAALAAGRRRRPARRRGVAPELESLEALCRGVGLESVAQPILRLCDGQLVGYELLARSRQPGLEQPDEFFGLAAREARLVPLDRACFDQALRASRGLPRELVAHINLYPATLLEVPPERLLNALDGAGPRLLVELSEQQILGDPSYLRPAIRALRAAGLELGIDDVGFGRSCLESLVLLEPEWIKLDRRMVHGLAQDPGQRRALARLLALSEALGARVVAEGIETRADLAVLLDHGVERGQGFLWGPPRGLPELESARPT
jgi:diguanylate cyclase (GGDEF)-like protein